MDEKLLQVTYKGNYAVGDRTYTRGIISAVKNGYIVRFETDDGGWRFEDTSIAQTQDEAERIRSGYHVAT